MTEDRDVLRAISWRDVFPWVLIFRTFGISFQLRILLLAIAGVILVDLGWWGASQVFLSPEERPRSNVIHPPIVASRSVEKAAEGSLGTILMLADPIQEVWVHATRPYRTFFSVHNSVRTTAYRAFCALWATAVWSIFGGAICRIAALALTRDERCGLKAALKFGLSRFLSFFTAPLFPMLGVLAFAIPSMLLGLLAYFGEAGLLISGVLYFIAAIFGVMTAALLIPLLFGWPLMWGAISTEASDAFDALSRSYAYVTQRPLNFAFYSAISLAVGALGLFVASVVVIVSLGMTDWAFAIGAGEERLAEIQVAVEDSPIFRYSSPGVGIPVSGPELTQGAKIIHFWRGLVVRIIDGYVYGFFFISATAVYLLLRYDVDQAELDEVTLEDEVRFPPPSFGSEEGEKSEEPGNIETTPPPPRD
ncbi:hypothetical protein LOC68_06915 [Blastopirellula sp. JC732]|uniref:Uncharacterized protein n=1 Tax=Blastopirellula sediminis TaxID=2894196 RepID=A0A9X1SG00_9BACT|nr:hypothetical protein [Blastopirellula sediminis]MCC9609102.1 hypothetical protein [Blastopirellula sediminis]MCC9628121.1 hypothetical protein [Blastopirellula sediminis]